MSKAIDFVIARMQEPSTWAGLAALCGIAGHHLQPGFVQDLTTGGVFVGGLAAMIMKDRAA